MRYGLSVRFSRLRAGAQRAQALVEYALILVLVAIVVIAGLTALAGGISGVFTRIVDGLK
ncbi:MAG TPA: Flp family type IVb pilin [Candidatus Dormibacteraeota bacterium]|nr:Flp family type IVb pilin [Candidatus Dormibacteraeota bacterium]